MIPKITLWRRGTNELAGVDGTINEADVARAQVLANMLNPVLGETIQLNKDGTATRGHGNWVYGG